MLVCVADYSFLLVFRFERSFYDSCRCRLADLHPHCTVVLGLEDRIGSHQAVLCCVLLLHTSERRVMHIRILPVYTPLLSIGTHGNPDPALENSTIDYLQLIQVMIQQDL